MSHIWREFVKILFHKRTYFGWAGLFLVPFLITIAMRFSSHTESRPGPSSGQSGMDAGWFFDLIASNGLLVTVASLLALMAFFLPLLAAMAGSQTIAGEAENGTLRTLLMQPVSRSAVLMAKWFVANVSIAIGLILLAAGSLLAGGVIYDLHPLTLLTGQTVSMGESIWLIFLSYVFALVAMATVVSLSVAFSTLTNSSLTAVGAALVLVIVMLVLGSFQAFDFLEPYLFTTHFNAWIGFFGNPIDWEPIRDAFINFAAWIVAMTGVAWLVFRRKDILS